MSPRRPSSPHAGAREQTSGTTAAARGVPTPRGGRPVTGRASSGRPGARPSRGAAGRSGGRAASTGPASRGSAGAPVRGVAGAAHEPASRLPRMFTVRAMVLFVVLLLAFVLLFPTVRAHLAQQAENRQLASELATARDRTEELRAELERWDDPAYVAAQARGRLAFVRPGETSYRVVDPQVVPDPTAPAVPEAGVGPALVPEGTTTPWYTTIWESVRMAGEAQVAEDGSGVDPAVEPTTGTPADLPAP
ncbi:septum formation initiator family protein [uncultured Cellulomonas sp.]|uniref:FtsB family cell division protein n=1 Tax=uncultured Cellulomonas sp. TaxID=189682 RepID=UPI0026026300|nr:septum formation initiator family protein [uncultured Cellulomonas sp.]